MKEKRDGQIDEERANLQCNVVRARCAKFTGTVVAWINCWKAVLEGFSNT